MFSIPAFLGVVMATLGVCSSTPPTPPTASAESTSEPFFVGLKKVRYFTKENLVKAIILLDSVTLTDFLR